MNDTLIKRVLLAIKTRVEHIAVQDGFHYDVGQHVYLGQRHFDQLEDGQIRVCIYRGKSTAKDDGQPVHALTLPITVEIHIGVGNDAAAAALAAEDVVGDLKQALLTDQDRNVRGLVQGRLSLLSDEVLYPDAGSSIAGVRLVLSAGLRETYGDPYDNPD